MATLAKNESRQHLVTIWTDRHEIAPRQDDPEAVARLTLVGKGRRCYLWVGSDSGGCFATFGGPATLRALAKAILEEVGAVEDKRGT